MEINLAYHSVVSSNYYEPLSSINSDKSILDLICSVCSVGYSVFEQGIYICANSSVQLPAQGWKIHISATVENAFDIVSIVATELSTMMVSFKVIKSKEIYGFTSLKSFSRVQFGKFITVYPKDNREFISLLEKLSDLLDEFDGPEILTDRQYKSCKVLHYRYGGFHPILRLDHMGNPIFMIQDGYGTYVEDLRVPYYSLPNGIDDIIDYQSGIEIPRLFQEYTIEKAIRFTNSGGVYLATQKSNQRKVIIKEARKHTQMVSIGKDSISYREREAAILDTMKESAFFPQLIDAYFCQGNFFLVEEYIDGETLFEYVLHNNAFLKVMDSIAVSQYTLKILSYISLLFEAILELRHNGLEMHDLTLDNIMITSNSEIKIIDMEGCAYIGDKSSVMGKNRYTMDGTPYSDLKELGLLLFSCIVPYKDALITLNNNIISSMMEHMGKLYVFPNELSELIFLLVFPDENSLSLVPSILQRLQDKSLEEFVVRREQNRYKIDAAVIQKGIQGIINTYHKTKESMFPTTPILQNNVNYMCGFTGVVVGLNQFGYASYIHELCDAYMNYNGSLPVGLYTGWAGLAWALLDHGEIELAERIYYERCANLFELHNNSILSGKSGILLLVIKLWIVTQDEQYYIKAIELADSILTSFVSSECEELGLMRGASGVALAMLAVFRLTSNAKYINEGIKLLREEIKYSSINGMQIGFPDKKDGKILYPYFMHGTAGILSVVLKYIPFDSEFEIIARNLADGMHYGFSTSAALFDGMAGIGNTYLDCAHFLGDQKYLDWATEAAHFCLSHSIDYLNDAIVFPDSFCQKISVDYGFGSIGTLLFLDRCCRNKSENFALPLDSYISNS